jgi:hypothetical protein
MKGRVDKSMGSVTRIAEAGMISLQPSKKRREPVRGKMSRSVLNHARYYSFFSLAPRRKDG